MLKRILSKVGKNKNTEKEEEVKTVPVKCTGCGFTYAIPEGTTVPCYYCKTPNTTAKTQVFNAVRGDKHFNEMIDRVAKMGIEGLPKNATTSTTSTTVTTTHYAVAADGKVIGKIVKH